MSDTPSAPRRPEAVAIPVEDLLSGGPRGEALGCPTGLAGLGPDPAEAAPARGPLQLEKLEGRQESGRDAQDEDEEDEGPA